MSKSKRRFLGVILALVLIPALTITALAVDWTSFQGHDDNNGVIDNGTPPTSTPSVTTAQLLSVNATTGVDSQSIIGNGVAYTLYNGGTDGACLAIVNLATPIDPVIPVVIDQNAQDTQQLSTPYLDTDNNILYLAVTYLNAGTHYWRLYSLDVSIIKPPATPIVLAEGIGQIATPISAAEVSNPTNIYFGTYTGSRTGAYYQYNIATQNLVTFTPKTAAGYGDDFYLAGAAFVTIDSTNYVVFGSDSAAIYIQSVSAFGNANVGNSVRLVYLIDNPGPVRSSIVKKTVSSVEYIFFTSGGASRAILWQAAVDSSLLASGATISNGAILPIRSSTSTPVISVNNIVYVGGYTGNNGEVVAYIPGTGTTPPTPFDTDPAIYNGDAVSSSPIVYSYFNNGYYYDEVYFTTNVATGTGYDYYVKITTTGTIESFEESWHYTGNSSAMQGFASDNGYLIFGNDANQLYIFH